MITQTFKHNKKIVCYIKQHKNTFYVCTGKPSDATCISWTYSNIEEAKQTAENYFTNRTNFFKP